MSTYALLRSISLATLTGLAALGPACKATEPHDRAAITSDKVVAVGHSSGQTQTRLDQTLDALGEVVAKAKTDPKSAFDAFAKALPAFSDSFATLRNDRAALASSASAWFEDFEKRNSAIQDADLRKIGEDHLATFRTKIEDVSKQVDELMAGATAVETQLNNLRTYLGNDLTAGGIEAVESRVSDTTKDGRKVASGLGKLSKASGEVAEKLRAARPPPPEKK